MLDNNKRHSTVFRNITQKLLQRFQSVGSCRDVVVELLEAVSQHQEGDVVIVGDQNAHVPPSRDMGTSAGFAAETTVAGAKASAKPEIVDPSLAMTRKISPGSPSS